MNISDLQRKIESIDAKKWNELKENKMGLFQKCENLDKNADYSNFGELVLFWNQKSNGDDSMEDLTQPTSLKSAYELLQIVKNGWVRLKSIIESW